MELLPGVEGNQINSIWAMKRSMGSNVRRSMRTDRHSQRGTEREGKKLIFRIGEVVGNLMLTIIL